MDTQVTENDLLNAIQEAFSQKKEENQDGYITIREIVEVTGQSIRSVRQTVRQLLEDGLAEHKMVLRYTPMLDRDTKVPGYRMRETNDESNTES